MRLFRRFRSTTVLYVLQRSLIGFQYTVGEKFIQGKMICRDFGKALLYRVQAQFSPSPLREGRNWSYLYIFCIGLLLPTDCAPVSGSLPGSSWSPELSRRRIFLRKPLQSQNLRQPLPLLMRQVRRIRRSARQRPGRSSLWLGLPIPKTYARWVWASWPPLLLSVLRLCPRLQARRRGPSSGRSRLSGCHHEISGRKICSRVPRSRVFRPPGSQALFPHP